MEALIIDEQPLYGTALGTIIQDSFAGAKICVEVKVERGLMHLKNPAQRVDFILIGLDGSAAKYANIFALLRYQPSPKLVVLPSAEDLQYYIELLEMQVKGIVPKYYSMFEIMNAIRDVADGRTHLPPAMKEVLSGYLKSRKMYTDLLKRVKVTRRQVEILELLEQDLTVHQIGCQLFISKATVKTHINRLFSTLDVKCRTDCVQRSYELGILQ